MPQNSPETKIEALRGAIAQVEAEYKLAPDDPVFLELKRIILLRITQLEYLCPQADETARFAAD